MDLTELFTQNPDGLKHLATPALLQRLDDICEGTIAVDARARIVWINKKYLHMLGYSDPQALLGHDIEEFIPHSLLRQVVNTGEPILLDLMAFGSETFVVSRLPLTDRAGKIIGAVGFCLYEKLHHLKPLLSKFSRLQQELAETRRQLGENRRPRYTLASYVGNSPASLEVKRQARRAAQLDTTVLLLGETGTGKELLAQAIHASSDRASQSFIAVNAAAIPESLLEAEFFGVAPGAYTGADKRGREGKFKLAHGGTLFLDEVGDMPLQIQAKLLRVLQEQEIEPLGANKVIKVDVRIIAATSIALQESVARGRFRSDLYYRLNVLSITLPPLRDRSSDLEALCDSALEQINERTGMPRREITQSALQRLAAYDWPGNVRELRNVLEKAVLHSDSKRLVAEDFATILPQATTQLQALAHAVLPLSQAVAEAERKAIVAALRAAGGKKTAAAQLLGISRATLYEKLAQLKLQD
ncbi:sigma-54 interaction domain-containing protein [Pseudoduganella namucuonensis]|uniref:Transcriptional regulator containing PAS, AAA-type ATPase, and DNA-binding Fis domains n=1 Tax=Pseudoduganella namucuonensis TaxID=1035707 RepID=A0A1I7F0K8_9BURK|nr:sigma 54-interacting transcriptional regulator [Pseudoduganella namucuonensis]SFU29697.1 Transcriptional regulator containing PAS, AAA-type ATPase, and DNA-binding Fis domains [Pseudoduganella namucuonensis]